MVLKIPQNAIYELQNIRKTPGLYWLQIPQDGSAFSARLGRSQVLFTGSICDLHDQFGYPEFKNVALKHITLHGGTLEQKPEHGTENTGRIFKLFFFAIYQYFDD